MPRPKEPERQPGRGGRPRLPEGQKRVTRSFVCDPELSAAIDAEVRRRRTTLSHFAEEVFRTFFERRSKR